MTHSTGDRPHSPANAVHWLQLAFTFALSINIGAALLASTVIFPVWSASPEAAIAWTGAVSEATFFRIVSPVVLLLAIATLVISGRAEHERRFPMRLSAALYVVFFVVTLAYFVPAQGALQGMAGAQLSPAELGSSLEKWVMLNWVRQSLGVIALGAALHALGRMPRRASVAGAEGNRE